MRILEIVNSFQIFGGAENFALSFSSEINKSHELMLVSLYEGVNQSFATKILNSGLNVVCLQKKKKIDFKAVKKLKDIITTFKPDAIHTENNCLITAYLATICSKKKIFHTIHMLPKYEAGTSKVSKLLYKLIYKSKRVYPVAISNEVFKNFSEVYGKNKNLSLIVNGIDLTKFNHSMLLKDRHFDAVLVGRFDAVKNHQQAVNIFNEVSNKVNGCHFAFAGVGDLFNKYKDENINNHYIEFLGLVEDIPSLLSNTKIIILTSLHEAMPLSLIEGLASGCIVMANSVGGIPDLVEENENGYLFDVNDVNNFAYKMSEILAEPNKYQDISNRNVIKSNKYSLENMCNLYLNLFSLKGEKR